MFCRLVYEGVTDWAVLQRTMLAAGWPPESILRDNRSGKSNIDKALPALVTEAKSKPVIVVRDLDQDAVCAPAWLLQHPAPAQWMSLRIAVRSIEAWFLADRKNAAHCLRVAESNLPLHPDDEVDPKATLITLARKSSNQSLRKKLVPRPGFSATVGAGYVAWFDASCATWDLGSAEKHSPSLKRARKDFAALRKRYQAFLEGKS